MTRPFRLRRSELSTPGSNEKMMAKAATSLADFVILDLEDAVAPAEKLGARAPVVEALTGLDWGRKSRGVRVNAVDTEWCHDDIVEVVTGAGSHLDLVVVPKVKHPRDVWFVDTLLTQLERKLRLPVGGIGLEVLVEEAEALTRVEEIAACCDRLEALTIGFGDLSASLGMRIGHIGASGDGYPGDIWHYARNRLYAAARAHGLDPIDGPNADFRDPDGFRREARWASTLGAVGKWAIHPAQVEIANEEFSPTPAEVERAKAALAASQAAESAGEGAAGLDGVMLDAATTRIFEAILRRAEYTKGI